MAEVNFTDINIIGNNASKRPRKEVKNTEGKDQFLITFSLSGSVKGNWVENFNRIWTKRDKQSLSLQLPIVSDNQIQIICPLDERLQERLDDLKREIATTNQLCREQAEAAEAERQRNDDLLNKLVF